MNRRNFLVSGAMAMAALGVPLPSSAVPGNARKLLVVFAPGGWDVTRVFAPQFGSATVAMEADADRATAGGLTWVSHPLRPNVDSFFQRWHDRALVLNGVLVRSIAHEICTMISLTGTSSGVSPDWPAIVADQDRLGYTLPHLVLSGPSFPGDKGVAVARTGTAGQLEALVSGEVENWSRTPVSTPRSRRRERGRPVPPEARDRGGAGPGGRAGPPDHRVPGLGREARGPQGPPVHDAVRGRHVDRRPGPGWRWTRCPGASAGA
jgi:hypothetical protein